MYGTPKGTALGHLYSSVRTPEEGSQVTVRNQDALTPQGASASSKGLDAMAERKSNDEDDEDPPSDFVSLLSTDSKSEMFSSESQAQDEPPSVPVMEDCVSQHKFLVFESCLEELLRFAQSVELQSYPRSLSPWVPW